MRIIYSYQGRQSVFEREANHVVVGRPKAGVQIDLDLTPDERVSRPHARVWEESGAYWIEDLDSTHGTRVNGDEIKGKGKRRLQPGDRVRVGETTLRVESPVMREDSARTSHPDEPESELVKGITQSLDAAEPAFTPVEAAATDADQRLPLLYELSLRFGAEMQLDALLQLILERIVGVEGKKDGVVAVARRGALLVKNRRDGELLLEAHLPQGEPAYSDTLAERAMTRRESFIWSQDEYRGGIAEDGETLPSSAIEHNIESAMYAPLLSNGQVLGVVCVDNCGAGGAFTDDDLRLLQAVAHLAALAIANLQLQEELRRENKRLSNFLKLVSPQLAERLKHDRGKIRLGGEFRDATILFSDMRGFTNLSANMEPDDVTEMLEDYFGRLVPIISEHHGMIDKFVGDAIVAVFGSPEDDSEQHLHSIHAALEMQTAIQEINLRRKAQGKSIADVGIGIHCGEVVHGFIGSNERMEFTVIGDTVNRASRHCDGAGKGEVLISQELYKRLHKLVEVEAVSIETKHEGELRAYRIERLKVEK